MDVNHGPTRLPEQASERSKLGQSGIIQKNAPVAQLDRAIASGAIGQGFESLRARHSSFWKIRSNGFLYVGVIFTASILQFESTILSNFACSG
jgi:hypothetical protein